MNDDKLIPVTIAQAAEQLGHPTPTVRVWASRHHARKVPFRPGKTAWYDYRDLATIEGCLFRKEPVPPTPEERDALRAHRRATALAA